MPMHPGEIRLFYSPVLELPLDKCRNAFSPAQDHDAGRIGIQAMNDMWSLREIDEIQNVPECIAMKPPAFVNR